MRCTLDLYSGQINPAWDLTAAESAELLRRLESLSSAASGALADQLGYRGIVVAASGDATAGLESLTVSAGFVLVRRADDAQFWYCDTGRALERWLLCTSKGRIQADEYAAAQRSL